MSRDWWPSWSSRRACPNRCARFCWGWSELLTALREQIAVLDERILAWHRANPCSRRLSGIDGFGPILSSALALRVQEPQRFACGRDLSAWIGLAPKQNSSGGESGWERSARRAMSICAGC